MELKITNNLASDYDKENRIYLTDDIDIATNPQYASVSRGISRIIYHTSTLMNVPPIISDDYLSIIVRDTNCDFLAKIDITKFDKQTNKIHFTAEAKIESGRRRLHSGHDIVLMIEKMINDVLNNYFKHLPDDKILIHFGFYLFKVIRDIRISEGTLVFPAPVMYIEKVL